MAAPGMARPWKRTGENPDCMVRCQDFCCDARTAITLVVMTSVSTLVDLYRITYMLHDPHVPNLCPICPFGNTIEDPGSAMHLWGRYSCDTLRRSPNPRIFCSSPKRSLRTGLSLVCARGEALLWGVQLYVKAGQGQLWPDVCMHNITGNTSSTRPNTILLGQGLQ